MQNVSSQEDFFEQVGNIVCIYSEVKSVNIP